MPSICGQMPLPGTKRRPHLAENAAAASIALTVAELASLEAAFPPGAAQGTRYPATALAAVRA